jgi:hypothetical protein
VSLEIVATFVKIVPPAAAGSTFTVKEKSAEPPDVSVAIVQVTGPFTPTAGAVQRNAGPEFWRSETNVIPAGKGSLSETDAALSGHAFEIVRL